MNIGNTTRNFAFSLVEVIVAVAVFATAIVAVLGFMGTSSRRIENYFDSATANSLFENIRAEFQRVDFDVVADATDPLDPIELVATADGSRVGMLEGLDTTANNPLNHATFPGIAERDRRFMVRILQQPEEDPLAYRSGSGVLVLRADIFWPYQNPVGPPSETIDAIGSGADPFVEVPEDQRRSTSYFFVVNR